MTIPLTACPEGGPATFDPDTVWNYEAGEKALLADNRIRVNADVYYIKWDKVQQTALLSCGTQYTTNAGDGIELRTRDRDRGEDCRSLDALPGGDMDQGQYHQCEPRLRHNRSANSGYSFPDAAAPATAAASPSSMCRRRRPAPPSSTLNRSAI